MRKVIITGGVIFLCLLFLGACKLQEESISPISELDEGKINQLKNWFVPWSVF
jgi:hypothetical protein